MLRFLASLLLLPLALLGACTSEQVPAPPPPFTSERITVTATGTGPDVVLLSGLGGHPEIWSAMTAAIPGRRYHIVEVAGLSGRPAGANASGAVLEPVAGEIARYIREARLERPALIGHSMGGSLAMMVAARNPELASRVMVIDMIPFVGAMFGTPESTAESIREVAEPMRQRLAALTADERREQAEETVANLVRTPERRPRIIAHSLASDTRVSDQAFYDLVVTDLRPELRNIRVPVTVLWVEPPELPFGPEQLAENFRTAYANLPQAAVIRQIPDSYHFIMLDQPAAFEREVRSFLEAR